LNILYEEYLKKEKTVLITSPKLNMSFGNYYYKSFTNKKTISIKERNISVYDSVCVEEYV